MRTELGVQAQEMCIEGVRSSNMISIMHDHYLHISLDLLDILPHQM